MNKKIQKKIKSKKKTSKKRRKKKRWGTSHTIWDDDSKGRQSPAKARSASTNVAEKEIELSGIRNPTIRTGGLLFDWS